MVIITKGGNFPSLFTSCIELTMKDDKCSFTINKVSYENNH